MCIRDSSVRSTARRRYYALLAHHASDWALRRTGRFPAECVAGTAPAGVAFTQAVFEGLKTQTPLSRGLGYESTSGYQVALRGAAFLAAGAAFLAAALAGAAFLTTGPVGVVIALCGRTLP